VRGTSIKTTETSELGFLGWPKGSFPEIEGLKKRNGKCQRGREVPSIAGACGDYDPKGAAGEKGTGETRRSSPRERPLTPWPSPGWLERDYLWEN